MSARLLALASALAAVALEPAAATAGSCGVTTVLPVAFGTYDIFDPAPALSTGAVLFECTDLGPADTVRIDLDGGGSHQVGARTIIHGTLELAYNLYLDAAHRMIWGDGTGGSTTYGPVRPDDGVNTVMIYGKIPARQDARAGAYSDTITVTIQF